MDKYIGRLLDNRYEILEVLGTGGMAVVYKARCHRLNRLVAIKILKDDYLEDEEFRRRFHSESQAVAMLSHPNIVSVYDVSVSQEADYIVMELIDGITLKQYMEKKGVLNWKETLHFAIQIAKALEHAHSRGIVHRDIKPHNVMVLKNGSVKVTDFGIARMMSKGNTLTKEALGSVHYISPEQAKGGRVDSRSDIYSLGVVMYEMMSGRPPYDGESPVAVAIQHINGGAAMPSTLNPNIPGGLEQIIMRAMAHAIADRYPSATAMLADMDEFRKDPAILFDYNTPPTDEVTKLPKQQPLVLQPTPPKSTAERVVDRAEGQKRTAGAVAAPRRRSADNGKSKNRSNTPNRRKADPEQNRSRVATIAIVSCSLVMVVAIVIFMVVLFNGGLFAGNDLVKVPQLEGKVYDTLPDYANFQIVLKEEVYHDTVPAGQIISHEPEAGTMVGKGNKIYVTVSLGKEAKPVLMPDVVNQQKEQVELILRNMSLKLDVSVEEVADANVPKGYIVRTEPAKNVTLKEGDKITLYVSSGPDIKVSPMPNVIGYAQANALKSLQNQGLQLDIQIEEVFSDTVQTGDVIRTEPVKGEELKTGQTVTLYVSKGPEMVLMPDVVGLDIGSAHTILKSEGLVYKKVPVYSDAEKDTVVSQSAEKYVEIPKNTEIVLEVSMGPAPAIKSKTISIDLPQDKQEAYELRIVDEDGSEVYRVEIQPEEGVSTHTVELSGSGVQKFKIYIADATTPIVKEVDFRK